MAGGFLAVFIPGRLLLLAFAGIMIASAVGMLRGHAQPSPSADLRVVRAVIDGVGVGLVTGLVGAGGGFLLVPALVLFGGLPMGTAVGTSLLVIAMKSVAGLGGYLISVTIAWDVALVVTSAAICGTLVGGRLSGRIPEERLRRLFGWFVLMMGAFVLLEPVAPSTWLLPSVVLLGGVVALGAWLMRINRSAGSRTDTRLVASAGPDAAEGGDV